MCVICVCVGLCHFMPSVDSCKCHQNQDRKLFYHHKGLSAATPLLSHSACPPTSNPC